jgi:hypothetical protein
MRAHLPISKLEKQEPEAPDHATVRESAKGGALAAGGLNSRHWACSLGLCPPLRPSARDEVNLWISTCQLPVSMPDAMPTASGVANQPVDFDRLGGHHDVDGPKDDRGIDESAPGPDAESHPG